MNSDLYNAWYESNRFTELVKPNEVAFVSYKAGVKSTKVLIIVEGGAVQDVYSDGASVTVIDIDNEREHKTGEEIYKMIEKAAKGLEPVVPD